MVRQPWNTCAGLVEEDIAGIMQDDAEKRNRGSVELGRGFRVVALILPKRPSAAQSFVAKMTVVLLVLRLVVRRRT